MTGRDHRKKDVAVSTGRAAPDTKPEPSKSPEPAESPTGDVRVTGYAVVCRELGGRPYITTKATSVRTAKEEFAAVCRGLSGGELIVTELNKKD